MKLNKLFIINLLALVITAHVFASEAEIKNYACQLMPQKNIYIHKPLTNSSLKDVLRYIPSQENIFLFIDLDKTIIRQENIFSSFSQDKLIAFINQFASGENPSLQFESQEEIDSFFIYAWNRNQDFVLMDSENPGILRQLNTRAFVIFITARKPSAASQTEETLEKFDIDFRNLSGLGNLEFAFSDGTTIFKNGIIYTGNVQKKAGVIPVFMSLVGARFKIKNFCTIVHFDDSKEEIEAHRTQEHTQQPTFLSLTIWPILFYNAAELCHQINIDNKIIEQELQAELEIFRCARKLLSLWDYAS